MRKEHKFGKKAAVIVWISLVGFLLTFVQFFIVSSMEDYEMPKMHPGKRAVEIDLQGAAKFKKEIAAEQIGKYGSWQALFDLGQEGGFSYLDIPTEKAPCGNVQNEPIAYWNTPDKDCYPDKITLVDAYYTHLTKAMQTYSTKEFGRRIDYEFSVIDKKQFTSVIGIAPKPIFVQFFAPEEEEVIREIPLAISFFSPYSLIVATELYVLQEIYKPETDPGSAYAGTYTYYPHFHAKLDYNFESIENIGKKARGIVETCKYETEKQLCVESRVRILNHPEETWEVRPWFTHAQNRVFIFKVIQHVENPYFYNQRPEMQFALIMQ